MTDASDTRVPAADRGLATAPSSHNVFGPYEHMTFVADGPVATLTLSRPAVRNALSMRLSGELIHALERTRDSTTVKVLVIRGAGGTFCAGDDITEMRSWGTVDAVMRRVHGYEHMANVLEELDKITVAVVEGYAVGGGLEITMACDFVLAADSAIWGMPEVDVGITPGWGGTTRMARLIGRRMTKEVNLLGALHPAARAAELGLWNRVVPGPRLDAELEQLIAVLLSKNQQALRQFKFVINNGVEADLHSAQAFEALSAGLTSAVSGGWQIDDADSGRGTAAFAEKMSSGAPVGSSPLGSGPTAPSSPRSRDHQADCARPPEPPVLAVRSAGPSAGLPSRLVEYLEVAQEGAAAVPLEGSRLTIGADPSNDVAVTDDRFVSRMHAVLERHTAGWLVRDIGSRNGTYVNGERIAVERVLRPGDDLRIGQTTMRFQTDTQAIRETLADGTVAVDDLCSASIVREGDYWSIVFAGQTSRVRDSKGMRYLALLLAASDREFHVLELTSAVEGVATDMGARSDRGETVDVGDAGAVLDARAKAEYRQRLGDLAEELEEASRFNDPERAARASVEIDALTEQLTAAVGLGGRDRRAASANERARLNVTRALRAALRRIAEADEQAGNHLDVCVRTGVFCSYRPDPAAPTRWRTSG